MGQVQSAFGDDGTLKIPDDYHEPSFPSLYGPSFYSTQRQEGIYLYQAESIWHFTLYWTLILLGGTFLLCSSLAMINLLLALTIFRPSPPSSNTTESIKLSYLPSLNPPITPSAPNRTNQTLPDGLTPGTNHETPHTPATASTPLVRKYTRRQPRKPPFWPVLLIPLIACTLAAVISVITATVIGFALAAVYSAGNFSMSTWVPFLWALIQVLVVVISSYSTLTSIL